MDFSKKKKKFGLIPKKKKFPTFFVPPPLSHGLYLRICKKNRRRIIWKYCKQKGNKKRIQRSTDRKYFQKGKKKNS